MVKNWGDTKRLLAEDILVYLGAIILDFFGDPAMNLIQRFWIGINPHELAGHPYKFGIFQGLILVFCAIQLIRKLNDFKYFSNLFARFLGGIDYAEREL